jgi:hypothetical protein
LGAFSVSFAGFLFADTFTDLDDLGSLFMFFLRAIVSLLVKKSVKSIPAGIKFFCPDGRFFRLKRISRKPHNNRWLFDFCSGVIKGRASNTDKPFLDCYN